MIVEWFFSVATGLVQWLVGLFPDYTLPEWFAQLGDTITSVTAGLSGMGAWVNWVLLNSCIAAVILCWSVFGGIKLIRVAAGHIPGGVGGNG